MVMVLDLSEYPYLTKILPLLLGIFRPAMPGIQKATNDTKYSIKDFDYKDESWIGSINNVKINKCLKIAELKLPFLN